MKSVSSDRTQYFFLRVVDYSEREFSVPTEFTVSCYAWLDAMQTHGVVNHIHKSKFTVTRNCMLNLIIII